MLTKTASTATADLESLQLALALITQAEDRLESVGCLLPNTPAAKDYPAVKRSIATVAGTRGRLERRLARLQAGA